jgi:lipid-binding SYLF domain-containing protein
MLRCLLAISPALLLCQCASTRPQGSSAAEQREFIDAEAARIIDQLVGKTPEAEREIAAAEGVAAFRYSSGKLPIVLGGLGGGAGYGVAVDQADDSRTYMKVQKVNWGWGMGVKENAVVFVFEDRAVFDKFRAGKWDSGAAAEATAKKDDVGAGVGATATAKEGFKAYTLTDSGLSYGITYQARRFSPIGSLNR